MCIDVRLKTDSDIRQSRQRPAKNMGDTQTDQS